MSATAVRPPSTEVRVMLPHKPGVASRLRELWAYRATIPFFGARFIEKSYLRTWLGWLWIPLRPAIDVSTNVFVFGGLLSLPSNGVPYFLFFIIGNSVWQLFATGAYWATRSVELNRRYLRRLYIPRLTMLVGSIAPALLHFAIYGLIAAGAVGYFALHDGSTYLHLGPATLLVIPSLAMVVLMGWSIGLWTSVYAVEARDVRFGLAYVLGFWYFLTPVLYPLSAVPSAYSGIARFNPMTAPAEMVRYGFFGIGGVPVTSLVMAVGMIVVVGGGGLWFFSRSEERALNTL
jgi:lipopolysaccharide transport system permease protein